MTVLINAQWQGSSRGHRYPIGAERIRAMLGPENTVTPDISYRLGSCEVHEGVRDRDELLKTLEAVDLALATAPPDEPIYNLGCDCGGELVPIGRLNERQGGELRVIWFDAHPDLNSVETSVSGTFHGMVLRALLGDMPASFSRFAPVPLKAENVLLAGVRSIDPGEAEFIDSAQLEVVPPVAMSAPPSKERLARLAGGPVYVHVDYDILEPERHWNTAFPEPSGVALEDLLGWLTFLRSEFRVIGYGLTEFAPASILADDSDVRRILCEGFGLVPCQRTVRARRA